ncbi:hypothetical protein [Mesorhizobium sp. WSM3879]|nr:hypothetical protein [Mesorhizobium sp. WSM3879]
MKGKDGSGRERFLPLILISPLAALRTRVAFLCSILAWKTDQPVEAEAAHYSP